MNTLSSTLRSGSPRSALRPLRPLRNALISIVCIFGFAGCLAADSEILATDEVQQNALTYNALTYNALTYNALTYNALTYNALTYNRLSGGILLLDTQNAKDLPHTESGRQLLQYIARCALVEGDSLRVVSGGKSWDFPGLLGVAPSWELAPLDREGQEILSACLMAHVNAFGVSVPISVRSDMLPEASADESAAYYYGDGAFYGNLSAPSPKKYACEIRANRYFDEATETYQRASSPNAHERICADASTAEECDFVYTGYCDQVCSVERDGDQWRFSNCLGADGRRYQHAFTVWLQGEGAESCDVAPVGFTCEPN